jgi:hypothetical protein
MILVFALISCRDTSEDLQQIDQILNIYNSGGNGLLNPNFSDNYTKIAFLDLNGVTDQVPISTFSLKKDADTVNYIDYVSGAKRILIDSSNVNKKIYQSKIALKFTKTTQNSAIYTLNDTMVINYSFSPERFQIDNVIYNNAQVFTKTINGENTLKIIK